MLGEVPGLSDSADKHTKRTWLASFVRLVMSGIELSRLSHRAVLILTKHAG